MGSWGYYFFPPYFGLSCTDSVTVPLYSTTPDFVPHPAPLCLLFKGHPLTSFLVQITIPHYHRPCQPTQNHSSKLLGNQAALSKSDFPASQATKIRPQVSLGKQMLVFFVTSFAKPWMLLPTSSVSIIDTKGTWERTFLNGEEESNSQVQKY